MSFQFYDPKPAPGTISSVQEVILEPAEEREVALLEKYLPSYLKRNEVLCAMVVGAEGVPEATILRMFYSAAFNVPRDSLFIAGCNQTNLPHEVIIGYEDYNWLGTGQFSGNILNPSTWFMPSLSLGKTHQQYDLVYIRNPDLVNTDHWGQIFSNSIEKLSPDGIVVTFIRKSDVDAYQSLLSYLERMFNISPVLSENTSCVPGEKFDDHFILGVFRRETEAR